MLLLLLCMFLLLQLLLLQLLLLQLPLALESCRIGLGFRLCDCSLGLGRFLLHALLLRSEAARALHSSEAGERDAAVRRRAADAGSDSARAPRAGTH